MAQDGHWSYSRGDMPLCKWNYLYNFKTADERKNIVIGEAGALGTAVHSGTQDIVSSGLDQTQAVEDATKLFDDHPACEDAVKRSRFRECISPMINNAVTLLNQSGFSGSTEEHRIETHLPDVELPVIGFVDLLGDGIFCEIKTKAPVKTRKLKSGEQGWSKGRIPAEEPEWPHVKQAALYAYALRLTPSILYVAEHEAKLFTPFNCENLQKTQLQKALNEFRQRLLIKQNLLNISDDPKVLATIIQPDWHHAFIWKDAEQRKEAEQLWEI